MLDDILNETPFVKFLEARGEARGCEETLKQTLLLVVSARFPTLLTVAQEQVKSLKDTDVLNKLITQISVAQTVEEARQYILAAVQDEQA